MQVNRGPAHILECFSSQKDARRYSLPETKRTMSESVKSQTVFENEFRPVYRILLGVYKYIMIILDNLNLQDVEIMRVLCRAPSEGLTAKAVMSSGDNLVSTENVSKRLQKLSDLKLVIPLENTQYRLHLDGENLFWGRGELWSKFLHVVYVGSLEMGLTLERIQNILGEPEWKFKSALEILRPRGFLYRNDVKSMGGKEFHLWVLTPEGKKYVSEEFSAEQTRSSAFKTQRQKSVSAKTKERRGLTPAQEKLCWDNNPHICNLCGNQINRISEVEFDHSKAFTKGGKTNLANVKLSHPACNKQKGKKSLTEARKMLGYYSNIRKKKMKKINQQVISKSPNRIIEVDENIMDNLKNISKDAKDGEIIFLKGKSPSLSVTLQSNDYLELNGDYTFDNTTDMIQLLRMSGKWKEIPSNSV